MPAMRLAFSRGMPIQGGCKGYPSPLPPETIMPSNLLQVTPSFRSHACHSTNCIAETGKPWDLANAATMFGARDFNQNPYGTVVGDYYISRWVRLLWQLGTFPNGSVCSFVLVSLSPQLPHISAAPLVHQSAPYTTHLLPIPPTCMPTMCSPLLLMRLPRA